MGWTLGWALPVSCEGAMQGGKWCLAGTWADLKVAMRWYAGWGMIHFTIAEMLSGYKIFSADNKRVMRYSFVTHLYQFFLQFKRICNQVPRKISLTSSWSSTLAWFWWTYARISYQMLQPISDFWPEALGTDVCDIAPICIRDGVKTNKLPS